jgi:secreted Zn-dependent insulinase-like peptidase
MIPIAGLMMMTTSASNLEFPDIPKMIGDKYKETREKITKDSLFKQKKNIMELINKEKEIYTTAPKIFLFYADKDFSLLPFRAKP